MLLVFLAVAGGAVTFFLVLRQRRKEAKFELAVAVPADADGFSLALRQSLGPELVAGHELTLLENGALFDALERDLRGAKQSMHVLLYIWEKGRASDRIVSALTERARAGVSCRIVVDDLGSPDFARDVQPALAAAGCDVRIFRPLARGFSVLTRDHRKLVVIDGRVGFTGGFGIRDNWLGNGVCNERWRDTNVRFAGPAAGDAQQAFAENWQEAGGPLLPPDAFPRIEAVGSAGAAFVASTANPNLTRSERLEQLVIRASTRRLWISNAYFVPSRAILELLRERAEHGVDVRILVPGKQSDSKTSFGAQLTLYGDLVAQGVRIWEYDPSMMHAKTMVADDDLVTVASINLDPLSLGQLEETAIVMRDPALAKELVDSFVVDCEHAHVVRP